MIDEAWLGRFLRDLPDSPGVYVMRDSTARVFYVGKATSLRDRVRQYFAANPSDPRPFVRDLGSRLTSVDIVLTPTEKDAALLELNLIKKHRPRHNIHLTDDKEYPRLRMDLGHEWPRLEVVRRPARKARAVDFGPYPSASSARETLRLVDRHFGLRSCSDRAFANRVRPCLRHQMHQCLAPCVRDVDPEEYRRRVRDVRLFLGGRCDDLVRDLERRMLEASEAQAFERAAAIRDRIRAVRRTLAPQRVIDPSGVDRDVVGLHREGGDVQISVLTVREGRLVGRGDFAFVGQEFPEAEILSSFLVQRYAESERIPDEIVVSRLLEDAAALGDLFSDARGRKVRVVSPKRGPRADQASMADANARQALESRLLDARSVERRLAGLERALRLREIPRHIECVDISHLGGVGTVGAVGAVIDGRVERSRARRYRLDEAARGDDYRAMAELVSRRFRRARSGQPRWAAPDLLVVDGGRGQLARIRAVLDELGFGDLPVVALAKERAGREGEPVSDRVYVPGRKNPVPLRSDASSLGLLAAARDEAHRVANRYQAEVRRRRVLESGLDAIPGIGPRIRTALLRSFGSLEEIRRASLRDLLRVPGVGPVLARRIEETLVSTG